MSFVIDASIGISWIHPDQATDTSRALMREREEGAEMIVPRLWYSEMANTILTFDRRKLITSEDRRNMLSIIARFQFRIDEASVQVVLTDISELAAEHGLTIYDATYLEVAIRRGAILATRDQQLRAAAVIAGVEVR